MATVQGFISVTDLTDGVIGNAVIITNENHTFVADADGAVTAAELGMYETNIDVEAGDVNVVYVEQAGATLATNNTFTIQSAAVSGQTYRTVSNATIVTNVNANDGDLELRITDEGDFASLVIVDAASATDGFVDANSSIVSATITIPVIVRTSSGTVTYNRTISLSKALGGSAPYVRMTSSDQSVEYAYLGDAPKSGQADIVLNALAFNTPASVGSGTNTGLWFRSNDNSTFTQMANTDAGVTITGENSDDSTLTLDLDNANGFDTHLGSARRVIYRYVRQADANVVSGHEIFDQISVFRVDDSESGYTVYVEVESGTTAFKNGIAYDSTDATTYADLVIRPRHADGTLIDSSNANNLTYRWSKNGTDIPGSGEGTGDDALATDQGSGAADTNLQTNYGVDTFRIRVVAADVEDNGADVFGCTVNFDYTG